MAEEYKLSVDECEKLIGHCWDSSVGALNRVLGLDQAENREETSKQCSHCGLREVRKVVTTYRLAAPERRE